MKYFPNHLQKFILDLCKNNLGGNPYNFKYLAEGMKWLSNDLQDLGLDISQNNLGLNAENLKYLG